MQTVAALSPLFSDSDEAYIDYRFVENVFALVSNGKNIGRMDKVFDTLIGNKLQIGVGVKTFRMPKDKNSQFEKIQEYTKFSQEASIGTLKIDDAVHEICEFRNSKILSDANELGIDLTKSFYHCFIRSGGRGYIFETDYPLIEIQSLAPTDKNGSVISKYEKASHVFFKDNYHYYKYSFSKNVLYMKFDLENKKLLQNFDLEIDRDIWQKISSEVEGELLKQVGEELAQNNSVTIDLPKDNRVEDFVVLPLYSTRRGEKRVEAKSGINQWNAGGRARKFGEAYIPIPRIIHNLKPDFFPSRDVTFDLQLPNSQTPVTASVCQDGSKALMSNPNTELCKWLYKVIDGNFSESDFSKAPNREPFTYDDLLAVGKDCVVVYKKTGSLYEIVFGEIGSYEDFIDSNTE
jgi:hypothetical protein